MENYINLIPEGVYWLVGIFAGLFFFKWYINRKHKIEGLSEDD